MRRGEVWYDMVEGGGWLLVYFVCILYYFTLKFSCLLFLAAVS